MQGASAVVVAASLGGAAQAQTAAILRGAGHISTAAGVPSIVTAGMAAPTSAPTTAAMTSASARAILNQAKAAAALSMAQQAQQAARASAAALNPIVGDGLWDGTANPGGGLRPAVAAPTFASRDPTGLATWQGAALPTQASANGQTTVTVTQTDARAILSWTSYDVGANTTLVYGPVAGATADPSWTTLNRVVGAIDPATGLRDPARAATPSQILGRIKAPWEILVLNPNGVLFTGTAQVNTHAFIATSLDVGQSLTAASIPSPLTIAERNQNFLTYGLLGYAQQASVNQQQAAFTFSAEAVSAFKYDPTLEGAITVQAGAQITSDSAGFLLFAGPQVVNAGTLLSPQGEVALQSGRQIFLKASDGTTNSGDPNVRGFITSAVNRGDAAGNSVVNASNGLVQADGGYISLGATPQGAVVNQGVLASSTSISRNGYVKLDAGAIQLAPGSAISIVPDDSGGTIPQDPQSLANFKRSRVVIGGPASLIEMSGDVKDAQGNVTTPAAFIYAPSAAVQLGAAAGATTTLDSPSGGVSRIFIGDGAVIDVAGLTDVQLPASTNSVQISPITTNDLQDSPTEKALLGKTVYIDPRISGVRADGVAWVGSPILSATGFAQQVGVQASQLMTKGGNVTLGVASANPANPTAAPDIVVKPGAMIDVSGGWVSYQAGWVRTSRLINTSGEVVDIADANPNTAYIGVYTGYTASQPRWGISQSYADPIQSGLHYEGAYTEGRDAGSLTILGSVVALDGTVHANAFAGVQQLLGAKPGTAASSIYGDSRALQATGSQLPAGGYLSLQGYGQAVVEGATGGADIEVTADGAGSNISDLAYGQTIAFDSQGRASTPARPQDSRLPNDRYDTVLLSATALNDIGLSELSLQTTGKITIDQGADLQLQPGGVFVGLSGRSQAIEGSISVPGGKITLTTAQLLPQGSVVAPDAPTIGSFDITVDGTLSAAGRWVNDFNAPAENLKGAAFLNGGAISLTAAPGVTLAAQTASVADTLSGAQPKVNTDISGSIAINSGALLDLSGGGYVSETGGLTLTSKGGDLSLTEATTYFQLVDDGTRSAGAIEGIRVSGLVDANGVPTVAVNPSAINARVAIAANTIRAHGFAGGGVFSLTTPSFAFGRRIARTGTDLPLAFFQRTGFGTYDIVSYKTALLPNAFDNGLGGYNALLQTQVLTVDRGQVLNLTQSRFSPIVDVTQTSALRSLATGGDLYSVLSPGTAADAWDQLPVNLTLGGLMELKVARGGQVTGAPGASLTVGQLNNQGVIRLPGGALTQSEILPALYAGGNVRGVSDLSQVFGSDPILDEKAANALGLTDAAGKAYSNAAIVGLDAFYLLGDLPEGVGVDLAKHSTIDLSGAAIVNPRAAAAGQGVYTPAVTGKVLAGGTFASLSGLDTQQPLFAAPAGDSILGSKQPMAVRLGGLVQADGSLDVSGASAIFDEPDANGDVVPTTVWSDGGAVTFGGGVLAGSLKLDAAAGAPEGLGGTLTVPDLVLSQTSRRTPMLNELPAQKIQSSGVATLVAQGSLSTNGDVKLRLSGGFFLTSAVYGGTFDQDLSSAAGRDLLAPIVSVTGDLVIKAPYIALASSFQQVSTPLVGVTADHTVTFSATAIDITGAVRFDRSVGTLDLVAQQDLRLIGVAPWQQTFNLNPTSVPNSLAGQLAVNGDLNITAAQVYPTTATSFSITSAAANGEIRFARSGAADPAAPYSAGGSLLIQANKILQDGVVRAPLGELSLGSNQASAFAPATASLTIEAGSLTSVSASGLSIPYGTTTDQTEWFFAPTSASQLAAPPAGALRLAGGSVSIDAGASVDIRGGGDVSAYEFIPGSGGSHDLLSQFNSDAFTGDGGYQYPDHRQVYAIVPGLSKAAIAAYDPIYSSNYSGLYKPGGAGKAVYLNGAPGLAAGWYTLLPAQYAMLPGGMRVVQETGATAAPRTGSVLLDGTIVTSGVFGVAGPGKHGAFPLVFEVQSQSTFLKYSHIALTSGDQRFADLAASNATPTPRLPIDAGQLILAPVEALKIDAPVLTAPGASGRGAQVDISGANLEVLAATSDAPAPGVVVVTVDQLNQLNAASLLLGGERRDNADGSTDLNVAAQSVTVENDAAHPLSAPEIILAADGDGASITLKPGAAVVARGTADPGQTGDFVISGGGAETAQGALLRIANGPERLLERTNKARGIAAGRLVIGTGAILSGESLLLDSTGEIPLASKARLHVTNLAVDARHINFAESAVEGGGLLVTPNLQQQFAAVAHLTLRAPNPIGFAGGTYSFGDLTLDAPALRSLDESAVALSAGKLDLANSATELQPCADCGAGELRITAGEIAFSGGTLAATGFGRGVTLAAQTGVYAEGAGGLNVGTTDLSIEAPFVGDRATPATVGSTTSARAALTLTTEGAVVIGKPEGAASTLPEGAPGARLAIAGGSISVTGSTLRATAGELSLNSAGGISVSGGAVLATPGYSKQFSDSADPYSIVAPGGSLSLTARGGDIDLGEGTRLSVGGGAGAAGELSLTASGAVHLAATLDTAAPAGAASFALNTGGQFDLSAFERQWGASFTGELSIRSGAGDLALASDLSIAATGASLTADGGRVDVAGRIDTSGVNGGAIDLYGAQGVTLEATSSLLAQARGYGASDSRRATGGAVTLGTDGTGDIQVAKGALIDVSALNPADRLVPLASGGPGAFSYVAGDKGGSVTFRAPVVATNGVQDVGVTFAGEVKGADSVVLQGFEHVDLAAIAAGGDYVGVTQTPGLITLDLSQGGGGQKPNFLADNAPGSLVEFIQKFDLSAANARLGSLTAMPEFVARPGVELDYSGDITLASNWNLGAGVVDVVGAVKAGLMAADPSLPGEFYVLPGKQAAVFSKFTSLTYRTGGSVDGQPGVLTIRAGGKLDLQGSITDGFFNFADQTDPGYISLALGGGAPGTGARVNQAYLTPNCLTGDCTDPVDAFDANATSHNNFVYFLFPVASGLTATFDNPIPYSAAANAPDALGGLATPTQATGGGDPIGSAQLFPLLSGPNGSQAVQSWSYQLVGGAAASADPLRVAANSTAALVAEGLHPYLLSATPPVGSFKPDLLLQSGADLLSPSAWLSAFQATYGLADDAYTSIDFSSAPLAVRQALSADIQAFYALHLQNGPGGPNLKLGGSVHLPTSIQGGIKTVIGFFDYINDPTQNAPHSFADLSAGYHTPNTQPFTGDKTAYAPTLIRTGTGSIALAAAGTIDLRNGADPTLLNAAGDAATANAGGKQLGGVAVYTAGHLVDTSAPRTSGDGSYQLDASGSGSNSDIFQNLPAAGYRYGAGSSPVAFGVGFTGILPANPVYADGGGDVSLSAGQDVLGRRDLMQSARLNLDYSSAQSLGYSWIGQGDQPWRTGSIGAATDIRIDPQLFHEGLGALGGGSISVTAGGAVSDISVVADTSAATAQVTALADGGASGQALMTFGGGDVSIKAGGDLLGGRVHVASGAAAIDVGGDVTNAGSFGNRQAPTLNELVLRMSDATLELRARGDVALQGVAALGVRRTKQEYQNNLDALGFYSSKASLTVVADGSLTIRNAGIDANNDGDVLLTPAITATGGVYNAVYPGSFEAIALTGDLNLATPGATPNAVQAASTIVMLPSSSGSLTLAAAGDITSVVRAGADLVATKSVLNMEDANPNLLPGVFSSFTTDTQGEVQSGLGFGFNPVFSNTPQTTLFQYHNATPTHAGDANPNRIYAGSDILDVALQTPKATRIAAGRDIVDMVFFGQNLAATDITRITAGRDITATTTLVNPVIGLPDVLGAQLPAVQGSTFVIGGPGSFFLEAGRNLGPFLNSATTNGFGSKNGAISAAGQLIYGGGVLAVGNEWNPWLPQKSADLFIEFGVANGHDFAALAEAYVDPANLATMPDYLFAQVTDEVGLSTPDRTKPTYGPILIKWMQANAAGVLTHLYGSLDVTYQQAYAAFETLPQLDQRRFLLHEVYFNELAQTSIPTSPSYLQYARGYRAVNTLFPASLGYTLNNLSGGANGASTPVHTGDLDLRLATIQTDQGGDVTILGPGGRVLAGSTVSTAEQAARRAYIGGPLFDGGAANGPLPAAISSIPVGKEGVLTLQGGTIYAFTDQSFLLNQSRLFTEDGGDILMWSSNADLNAGEGPKTSANFPPIAVSLSQDLFSQINKDANVTGAGIAAFQPAANVAAPNVYLIAPRGTVDAGAAGVRVAGNLFIAANAVANAENFKVSGSSFGLPQTGAVNIGAQSTAGAASAAQAAKAQAVAGAQGAQTPRSQISVNIQGYAGDNSACPQDDPKCKP
jgi:filamentous hemagglutinin family protein